MMDNQGGSCRRWRVGVCRRRGWSHRREVAFCVLASNLLTQIPPAISAFTTPWPVSSIALWAGLNLTYYVLLSFAALAKSKKTVGIAVAAAILLVTGATALFA